MMPHYAANPHATRNLRNGRNTYQAGLVDAERILRAYLADRVGTACDYFFAMGYAEAAEAEGKLTRDEIRHALRLVDPVMSLPPSDQIRQAEIICDAQIKAYGHAPYQWKLDWLRRKHAS